MPRGMEVQVLFAAKYTETKNYRTTAKTESAHFQPMLPEMLPRVAKGKSWRGLRFVLKIIGCPIPPRAASILLRKLPRWAERSIGRAHFPRCVLLQSLNS